MKAKIILWITAVLVVATLIFGYLQMTKGRPEEDQHDQPVGGASPMETSTNDEAMIKLKPETQKLIGLETVALAPATLPPERRCYGQVLDASPLIALASSIQSARISLAASTKEYQRIKSLFDQGQNASARALETAEAALKRDKVALQTAEAQLLSAWGTGVAQHRDPSAFVSSLAALQIVLVRLDLPARESITELPTGARLLVKAEGPSSEGVFLERAPLTDPQVQGQGFFFVVTNTPPQLAPGLALTGFLTLPGEPLHGVILPEAAVVRAADQVWCYVQTGPTTFVRRGLDQEHPVPGGWFVTRGFEPGNRIVTTGAQLLLSEERKSEIKVED